jgi:K+-transporting ATPase KdpF subunit
MIATILLVSSKPIYVNNSAGYIIGAVLALLIFGYLIYSLVKPGKF